MNQYREEYRRKLGTVDEALELIESGDVIGTSQCANDPVTILGNFHKLHGKRENIHMFAPISVHQHPFMVDSQYRDTFTLDGTFFMSANRASFKNHMTSFCPGNLHSSAVRWAETYEPNVFIGAATPMDDHGYMQVSLCLIHERVFLDRASKIILEINPNLPRVYGDTEVHIRDVDMVVEVNTPIPTLPRSEPSELEKTIGAYIASLVEDGDTIQLGIGGIPDAVALALLDKHDLGVHTEMITNSVLDLVEAGVITGKKKTVNPRKIIGAFAFGTQELYDMMDDNPSVRILSGTYVTNPTVIAAHDHFRSITSAISIDLTGQVCSESIGSRQYSGSGGQVDTAVGANHSKGGASIIAIPSTKRDGTVPSIVPQLAAGSVVTLSRNDVDYIVTEYGIAPMRGRSVRERVNNLIAISHPDFRAELRKEADKLLLW